MSNGLSGVTNYIHFYEQDRTDAIREAKNRVIRNYIISFGRHAKEVTRTCPVCGKTLITKSVYTNKIGKDLLVGNERLTADNLKKGLVQADWTCNSCKYTEQKSIPFIALLEDMNNPELRQKTTA